MGKNGKKNGNRKAPKRVRRGKGRPDDLTPEIHEKIVNLVRAGNYVETAAACVGIVKSTFYEWLKKGARKEEEKYIDFSNAIYKAQAESEARDVLTVSKATDKHWQAAAWRLERKFYEKWGRKDKMEVKFDWRKEVEKAGLDPDELYEHFSKIIDGGEEDFPIDSSRD